MSTDKNFHDYIMYDVFSEFSGITSKRMFGGYGFFLNGTIFGLLIEGVLRFKVNESNKKDYMEYGSGPFVYTDKKGREHTIEYWDVPEDILENREVLYEWIEKSALISHNKSHEKV